MPTGLVVTARSTTTISLAWNASTDDVNVAGYDAFVGGAQAGTSATTSYQFSALSCGTSYTLAVDAYDGAGNRSAQASLVASTSDCSQSSGGTTSGSGGTTSGSGGTTSGSGGTTSGSGGTLGSALPALLPASTWGVTYVATWGSDSSAGTAIAPWRTIQHALDVVAAGQTVYVRGGTYTEDLLLSRSGLPGAPITLAAYPGERVVLHAASTSGNTYPVQITGSYLRLSGFVIENGLGTSDANVYLWGGANHIELSHNDIRYGQDQGIFADRTTSDLDIIANGIHDNGWNHLSGQHQSHGIYIEGGNDLIANNLIYNHPYGFGITIYPANHDTIVTENAILASAHSSIVVGGSPGVYNITIRNNILYDDNWGVEMDSTCPTGPVAIDHNVIADYRIAPIQAGCATVDTSGGNTIADPGVAN